MVYDCRDFRRRQPAYLYNFYITHTEEKNEILYKEYDYERKKLHNDFVFFLPLYYKIYFLKIMTVKYLSCHIFKCLHHYIIQQYIHMNKT